MSLVFGSTAFIVIAAIVVIGIVIALIVRVGRRDQTDWAGDPRPPQPQPRPQQEPPRSIDDSQQFREQNRPTDPPAPA
jgi:hypothetical protein